MSKLDEIRAAVAECNVLEDGGTPEVRQRENAQRLRVFRQLDSYAAELTASAAAAAESSEEIATREALQRELEVLASTLVMRPIQPKSWPLFEAIDLVWRVPAVMLFLLFMGFVVSIPLIMLTLVEQQLFLARSRRRAPPATTTATTTTTTTTTTGRSGAATSDALPANAAAPTTAVPAASGDAAASAPPLSEHGGGGGNTGGLASLLIRLDCAWLLLLMGIHARAEGLNERSLSRPAMLLFTHVSTLDAVVILGTLPRALCAVVKEELLGVPVLGWIMASRGAIPINRRHRASAVQALAEAAERARELQMFVAMAPEGTRTKTGQLGPFKKGALHMQEQLGWPVIPVTIRGAYELFPLKWNVNQPGKVVVKYHKPIEAAEIKSRDGLSRRLREEMLEALENDPSPDAGTALDPSRRAAGVAAAGVTYWAATSTTSALVRFSLREGVSTWALVLGALAYVFLSTVFVFYVYARKCFSKPATARHGSGGGGGRGRAVENGDSGVALVGGAREGVGGKSDAEAVGTTEFSRLLGGDASSQEVDQMKDR